MNLRHIGANIRRRRIEVGLTLPELARIARVDKGNLSKLEQGTLGTSLASLERIAQALRTSTSALIDETNVSAVTAGRSIPIISWSEVGEIRGNATRDGAMHEYALFNITASAETFALRIEDDSMMPRFQPGDIVAIDPDRKPSPGSFVVARVGAGKYLRQYRELGADKKGPIFELIPLNPLYGPRRSDQDRIQLLGVAVSVLHSLEK